GPFGCKKELIINVDETKRLKLEKPLGEFNGFKTYTNRNHLAFEEIKLAWSQSESITQFISTSLNLPFYRALAFTLTYTFVVTPFVLFFGFLIALGVNSLPKQMKGPTIFVSLLPMIVTPLIGSLILFWMIDAQGIIGSILQRIFDDPNLSLKASPTLTWIMLMVYGVWHSSPFAFIVFYAGLQTVPSDTIEAAMIDGATRWERTKYVVLPHLMPLTIFILLIQLMDNFRVFEPIVGFSAQANATSLSWIIYNDISNNEDQFFGSAGATSVLTIIGISVLLIPVLIRTWREFNRKVV
ncbi:sugar ABC transporter permease, partial [Amylibacter sp.]|nr:sugar ABC transporter permease [Amylibacter sp.]